MTTGPQPPATTANPSDRARAALGAALGIVAPAAVPLRDGSIRLDTRERLPVGIVRALDERLSRRAADQAGDERILAEAVGVLGAEIARTRGDEPADGATSALDRLLHVPGLDQQRRDEAEAMLRTVLESAAPHSTTAARRLADLQDRSRTAAPTELVAAARQISREASLLSNRNLPAPGAAFVRTLPTGTAPGRREQMGGRHRAQGGRHRAQVGERHRSQVAGRHQQLPDPRTATPQLRGSGLVTGVGGRPVLDPDLTEGAALAALQQLGPAELDGAVTARPTINAQAKLAVIPVATADSPQHFRVEILPTGRGTAAEGRLRSGTQNDPHVLRLSPRLADAQLAQVWVHQVSQLTQQLDAARSERPTGVLAKVRSLFGRDQRDRRLTADYASYKFLTQTWHQAREQATAGHPGAPQRVADLERDIQALATAIDRRGGSAPQLPWSADAIYSPEAAAAGTAAAAAVQVAAAEAEPNTPTHLRQQVVREIAGLQSEVDQLDGLAKAKEASAGDATKVAGEKTKNATDEEKFKDQGAPERARKLQVEAAAAGRKAARHTEIAGAYRQAATDAEQALVGYQTLLGELDTVLADPDHPQTAIPELARSAAEQAETYQASVDRALPVKDVLHTGVPTGQPLELPTDQINQVLAARGLSARVDRGAGPLPLPTAAYRRVLSTSGMEFTVGGGPTDDVTKLTQVRLTLKARDVREVVDRDYDLAEQMSGTIGDGGQGVSTTGTHASNVSFGVDGQPLMAMAPPGSAVHTASQLVSPRVDVSSGRTQSVTAGVTGHDKQGAVDYNPGESLLVEWSGDWEIEVRGSATEPWSAVEPVDAGRQLTWVSSAYAVQAPADTVTLAALGRSADVTSEFPRHTVTDIEGLTSVRDRVVAGGRDKFGPMDRIAYAQINGLLTEDLSRYLRQASEPGGYGRQIVSAGEAEYHLQVEVEPIWSTTELSGESSPDHWQEEVQVDFAGSSANQSFSSSLSGSVAVAYPGKAVPGQPVPDPLPSRTALSDLGPSTADLSPRLAAGRNVSRQGGLNTSATSITPVVHRSKVQTQGVIVGLQVTATLRKLGDPRAEPVVVTDTCQARLRVPENDLLRCGAPARRDAVQRDANDAIRLDQDGRALLHGDAEPPTGPQTLPPTIGPGEEQLRGAGQALPQDLTGAEEAQADTLRALSRAGLVPPLDANLRPRFDALPTDRRRRAGQVVNYDRVVNTITAQRLEVGFNQAAQGGIPLVLVDQQTGHAPRTRTFRVAVHQDFADVEGRGTSTTDAVVRLGIASDASGRSGGRSRSVPLSAGATLSNGPAEGVRGWAGRLGLRLSRTAMGRSFGWTAGTRVNRVSLNETTGPVDKLRAGHRIVVTEITRNGDSAPLADVPGSARLLMDSALTRAAAPDFGAPPKVPHPAAVQQLMPVHVDAGDAIDRIHSATEAIQPGTTSYLELHAMLAPDSLIAHREWMNGEYRLPLTITPAPDSPAEAWRQGTVLPQELGVTVRGEAKNLTFVAITDQNTADINLTMKDTGFTSGRSASGGFGLDGGAGPVGADGSSTSGSANLGRTGGTSQSTTDSQTTGDERLLVNTGTHYQLVARFGMTAEVADGRGPARSVPLPDAKAQVSIPERRALRLYGTNKLDLPLHVVSDAAERYLEGKLQLSTRDATAFVARYKLEKAGATTGLAATHDDDRLTRKVLEGTGVPASTAPTPTERLTDTLARTQQLAEQPRAVALPDQYDAGLASAQIEQLSPVDQPGEQVDLLSPALRQVEEIAPGQLDRNPLLRAALATDLGTTGWQGHLDDMFGVRGSLVEIEVPVAGQPQPDLLVVRTTARYEGGITVDGTPEIPAVEAIGLNQKYRFDQRDQSVGHSTTYSAGLGGSNADGTSLSGSVGADRIRQVTAGHGRQNTNLDRTGHFDQAQVDRTVVFSTEVSRIHNAGAATMASVRWRLNRTVPAEQTTHATPAEVRARMTLLVPRQLITEPSAANAAAAVERPIEHRQVQLPETSAAEAMVPYGRGDEPRDQLFDQITGYLASHRKLGEATLREYQGGLEHALAPTAMQASVKQLTSEHGMTLPPIAGRGNGSTTFTVQIKARPLGWELQGPLLEGQAGVVKRAQETTRTSTTGNHLLPVTGTGGAGGGLVNAGGSVGEQVTEQSSDAHGTRLETSKFEEGELATVEVPMAYQVTVHEHSDTGRGRAKLERSDQLPVTAQAVYYVKMLKHEYLGALEQLEGGTTAGRADPQLDATPPKAKEPDLRATEYGVDASGKPAYQPYQPLLAALDKAWAEQRPVNLVVEEGDGHRRVYNAFPDGTMTSPGDNGYAAAFANLDPRVALMAEGRVPLRQLFNETPRGQSFNGAVARELVDKGVPPSILKGLDHSMTARQLAQSGRHAADPGAGQGARVTVGGAAAGRSIPSPHNGPSLAGQ